MSHTIHSCCAPQSRVVGRSSLSLAILLVALVALSHPDRLLAATTWVVSPAGNDSNPGTATLPFLTVQRAANVVNPGDTVIVEDGTYTGTGAGTPCAPSTKPIVCLARGGTSSAPVTFKARHRGGAKLDGRNNSSTDGVRFVGTANYIVFDGFEIFGVGNAAGSSSGFEMYNAGHHVVLSHNHVHDVGRLCTSTSNGQVGIFIEQPNVQVTANEIHDIGRFMNGENGCSVSYSASRDHGLYVNGSVAGVANILITNNLLYNNARGWSIQLYPGSLSNVSILNNTFAFPNPYQDGQIILGANLSNSRILNNVFYKPRTVALNYYTGTETSLSVSRNIVYGGSLLNKVPAGATVSGTQVADPLLVDPSAPPYDFHLAPGSPAIDAGITLAEVAVDFDGTSRSDGNDISAYERAGTVTASVATPAITPAGGTFSGPVTVSIATATSGATIRYTKDGTVPGTSSPIYTGPFVLSASATIRAQAVESGMTDSAVASAAITIQSDTTAPTVAITSPANGARVWKRTTIAATASDNVGVVRVVFSLDGRAIATDTVAPYATSYDFKTVAAGTHVIAATASDAAGHATTVKISVRR